MGYLGNTPTTQSFTSGTDYFNGTGSQTAFTLSRSVNSVNDIQVTVNNVVQQPNDAYTVSGTTLTMTSAPSSGTNNVYVRYLSTTTQTIVPSSGVALSAAIGTASSPSYSFAGDSNTGIFSPAADTIAFAEGGTEVARIDSSGNVGINTSSPTGKFEVKSANNTGTDSIIRATSNNGTASTWLTFNGLSVSSGNTFVFYNGTTEHMRITSGGDVCINATSAVNLGKTTVAYDSGSSRGITINQTNNAAGYLMSFCLQGSEKGSIYQNTSSTSYNTSSDYRLKENIAPMTGALNRAAELKPCTYTWKINGSEGEGFIAHELAEVVPQCVTGEKDAVDAEGNPVYQGIDTSFLVATLTAAIQELNAKVEAQAAEIAALKGANNAS